MKKTNIDKNKFFLMLLKNFSTSTNLDEAVIKTMIKQKIDKEFASEIKAELLPEGFKSLVIGVNEIINEKIRKEKKPKNFNKYRSHEKVKYYVIRRLETFNEILDKYKFFKETLKPFMFLNSSKILFKIADEIWFLSGDKSTDYNYYTKRFILMKVYALTFSFFIFDRSKNMDNTKKFLDKQIDLVLSFGKLKQKLKNKISI